MSGRSNYNHKFWWISHTDNKDGYQWDQEAQEKMCWHSRTSTRIKGIWLHVQKNIQHRKDSNHTSREAATQVRSTPRHSNNSSQPHEKQHLKFLMLNESGMNTEHIFMVLRKSEYDLFIGIEKLTRVRNRTRCLESSE